MTKCRYNDMVYFVCVISVISFDKEKEKRRFFSFCCNLVERK